MLLPDSQQLRNFAGVEFGQRDIVFRAVADDARDAGGRTVPVNPPSRRQPGRSIIPDTGVIVVEDERALILRISPAADPRVSGAKVTVGNIVGQPRRVVLDGLADPGTILPVSSNYNPFLTQRVPTLFPYHRVQTMSEVNDRLNPPAICGKSLLGTPFRNYSNQNRFRRILQQATDSHGAAQPQPILPKTLPFGQRKSAASAFISGLSCVPMAR